MKIPSLVLLQLISVIFSLYHHCDNLSIDSMIYAPKSTDKIASDYINRVNYLDYLLKTNQLYFDA